MELISGLITIVLLVLVPGLAYGQSPKSILKSCSAAVRAGVEGCAWSTVTSCASFYRADFVLRLDESRVSQWQRHMDESRIEARGRPQLRAGEARAVDRMSRGALPNGAWHSVAQLAGTMTVAAGLHPSVLKTVQPWLRGGYLDGSGHGDPADNKHGTLACILLGPPILPHTPFLHTYIKPSHSSQNAANIFPNQAFVRFKHLGGSEGGSLQIGRFEFLDGSEVMPSDPTLAALKRDRIVLPPGSEGSMGRAADQESLAEQFEFANSQTKKFREVFRCPNAS